MSNKFTKALVAALVLSGVSLSIVSDASAATSASGWTQVYGGYMQPRHNPTDTNGF
jgi:hypothetical protein